MGGREGDSEGVVVDAAAAPPWFGMNLIMPDVEMFDFLMVFSSPFLRIKSLVLGGGRGGFKREDALILRIFGGVKVETFLLGAMGGGFSTEGMLFEMIGTVGTGAAGETLNWGLTREICLVERPFRSRGSEADDDAGAIRLTLFKILLQRIC